MNHLQRLSRFAARREVAWLTLALMTLLTLGGWRYSASEFARRADQRFDYLVRMQREMLVDRMHDYERVLNGAAGLFAASSWVSREEWQAYVEHLALDQSLPGIQGTGFAMMLHPDSIEAHERAVRAEGFPRYTVHPVDAAQPASSIIYLEPFTGRNQRAFGYNMYAEPMRREAMDRARDTGRAALSGRVTLVQETAVDIQPGFLIYVPVYRHGERTSSVDERRAALLGFAYSPFRAHDLFARIFADPQRGVEVEIYDGEPAPGRLLYRSEAPGRVAKHVADVAIDVGGHRWVGRFRSSAGFEQMVASAQPLIILGGGLTLSLLVYGAMFFSARRRDELESMVSARTRDLERARDAAEAANRAKTAFLATVSHELRTPLNPIIGFSSLMLDDPDSGLAPAQRGQIAIINQCGTQLLDLIQEVLDISSIEAGHMVVNVVDVNLREVLDEQCESLQALAREAGLDLHRPQCDPSLEVLADPARLRQVLHCLLTNAIKCTEAGRVQVRVVVDGLVARVEVEDTGIGIAPEDQPRLFQRFQRVSQSDGKLRPGTGLGLAIARHCVEAMGGAIGVRSAPGRGSCFWFTLAIPSQRTLAAESAAGPAAVRGRRSVRSER